MEFESFAADHATRGCSDCLRLVADGPKLFTYESERVWAPAKLGSDWGTATLVSELPADWIITECKIRSEGRFPGTLSFMPNGNAKNRSIDYGVLTAYGIHRPFDRYIFDARFDNESHDFDRKFFLWVKYKKGRYVRKAACDKCKILRETSPSINKLSLPKPLPKARAGNPEYGRASIEVPAHWLLRHASVVIDADQEQPTWEFAFPLDKDRSQVDSGRWMNAVTAMTTNKGKRTLSVVVKNWSHTNSRTIDFKIRYTEAAYEAPPS